MPKKRTVRLFLLDILEAIDKIKLYTRDLSYKEFMQDEKTKDAVVRNLEIIGEASKNIPVEIKEKHSRVNWRAMSGMRDKLSHQYFGVSTQIVWETLKIDIPLLESQIKLISKTSDFDTS